MYMYFTYTGFYLEILFWGGNVVAKDSKKGHNTLLCTVGAFPTSQLQLLTSIPGVLLNIGQYLLN